MIPHTKGNYLKPPGSMGSKGIYQIGFQSFEEKFWVSFIAIAFDALQQNFQIRFGKFLAKGSDEWQLRRNFKNIILVPITLCTLHECNVNFIVKGCCIQSLIEIGLLTWAKKHTFFRNRWSLMTKTIRKTKHRFTGTVSKKLDYFQIEHFVAKWTCFADSTDC